MNIPTDQGALINRVIQLEEQLKEAKQHDYKMQNNCLLQENDYLRKSLESARGDTKALQKFIKGLGQAKVYADLFKKEAI